MNGIYWKIILLITARTELSAASQHTEGLFSYDPADINGPQHWSSIDLGDTDNACGGSKQSGIDIPTGPCNETNAEYEFQPGTCTVNDLEFSISDHSIQATYNASACSPPRMIIPHVSSTFEATQFHFHTGSEHALDGKHFGGELHVVHKEIGGQGLAVLGFFVDPTSFDDTHIFDALVPKWENVATKTSFECDGKESDVAATHGLHRRTGTLTLKENDSRKVAETFNPYSLVPEGATFYFYSGSLTTPPCTEIVSWNIVDKHVSLSVHEFMELANLISEYISPETCELATVAAPSGETSRPTQPLNGRLITHKCPTGTNLQFNEAQGQSQAKLVKGEVALVASFVATLVVLLLSG